MLGSKTSTRFLPLLLAIYIETSAFRSSSSAVCVRDVNTADADARVDEELLAPLHERGLKDRKQPVGDVGRGAGRGRILDEDREFVAAHPGDRVAGPQRAAKALGDADRGSRRPRRGRGCR